MVWSVVQQFRTALKYRGGVWGVLEHMYVVRTREARDLLLSCVGLVVVIGLDWNQPAIGVSCTVCTTHSLAMVVEG